MMSSTKPSSETDEYVPEINYFVEKYTCDYFPNPLQPLEDYKKRIAHKLKKTFIDDFHTLRDGYGFIGKYNNELKEHLKISPEIQKKLKNVAEVQAALNEGKTFQILLGWSNEDVREIYALADRIQQTNKDYYESGCIFKLLCVIQPNYIEFWLGSGNAWAAENRNDEALVCYFGGLNINPYAFDLYLGICQVLCKLSQFAEALKIIEGAQQVILTQQNTETDELPKLKEKLGHMHDIISSHEQRSKA